MVGPSPAAHGGIASVVTTLLCEPSLKRFDIEFVPTWVEGNPLRRLVQTIRGIGRFGRVVRAGDVVHIHVASRGSFARKVLIVIAARVRRARVLLHLHGGEFHSFVGAAPRLVRDIVRWVFRDADTVIVLSPIWRRRVEAFSGRSDSIVLPNPVLVPATVSPMQGPAAVVFLGRLGDQKGTPELLDAIALLQNRGFSDTGWILAGEGEVERFRDVAKQLPFPAQVNVPGWLSRTEVEETLARSWILCLPSHDEGKPVALLEAMAHGLACVATPVGGVPDLMVEEETGRLVSVGDADGLATTLESLLMSREECLRLGGNARRLVEREYSSARVGALLAEIYDALLQGVVL